MSLPWGQGASHRTFDRGPGDVVTSGCSSATLSHGTEARAWKGGFGEARLLCSPVAGVCGFLQVRV